MGIVVSDTVPIPNKGITISNFEVSCKGTYNINKESHCTDWVDNSEVIEYRVNTVLYWKVVGASDTIHIENLSLTICLEDIDNVNIFTEIYDKVKERYTNYLDV
jgi:hypothetical protein